MHLTFLDDKRFFRKWEGGGGSGRTVVFKRCLQPLTFSLLAIFRSIANFSSLVLTDREPDTGYDFLYSIHHSTLCPPTLMISKFPRQTETSPQSRNLLTSLVLITDLTIMESKEKVTIHLSKNKDSSVNNWRFKFEIQVSKINRNVRQEIVLLQRMRKLLLFELGEISVKFTHRRIWGFFRIRGTGFCSEQAAVSALTLPCARRYFWYPRYLLTSSRLSCRYESEEIWNKSNLVPKTVGFEFYDLIAVAGIRSVRVTSSKWSVLKNIRLLLTLLIKSAVGAVVDLSL